MTDADKVIKGIEKCLNNNLNCYHENIDCPYEGQCWLSDSYPTRPLKEDALAVLKEQKKLIEMQHNLLRSDADLISFLNKQIQEIREKPALDEYGRCFLNALKRQLDMKLQFIEILTTPDFVEKIVELFETAFDC